MSDIIAKLKEQIDKHDVISFDIFDTLLLRPYVQPTDLFIHLEQLNNATGFAQSRIQAEITARNKYYSQDEVTYEQIYEQIEDKYKYLKSKELDLERQVLTQNPEIFEVYKYSVKKGKRIILVSDMYLPKVFVAEILEKNGYVNYEEFYLSSELRRTKSSSELYKDLLSNINVLPKDILHIGDNYQSDIEIPSKLGITAFYYEKIIIRLFNTNRKTQVFYNRNSDILGASIILGVLAINSLKKEENYWKKLGYNYAGPSIYAYMKWLEGKVIKKNIKDILFVARDGYTLKKVFDIFKNDDIQTHYIYAPRFLYLLINLDFKSLGTLWGCDYVKTINDVLNYYKDKSSSLEIITPEITNLDEGKAFIEKYFSFYQRFAQEEKDKYLKYIDSKSIQTDNIALVDTASVSLSAQKFLSGILKDKKINGYYWLLAKKIYDNDTEYVFDAFQPEFAFDQSYANMLRKWDFMEFLITSPEPPICNIIDGNPEYKEISPAEKIRIEKYPFVSKGAIEFAIDIEEIFGKIPIFINYQEVISWLNVLFYNPTEEDKIELEQIKHASDPSHENYTPIFSEWYSGVWPPRRTIVL